MYQEREGYDEESNSACKVNISALGCVSYRCISRYQTECKALHILLLNIRYGVATISRLLKMIGLFCRIPSLVYGSFAKETCNFKELTHHSHLICTYDAHIMHVYICIRGGYGQ